MARPTIREKRRQAVSISVDPEILELASIGGNKSQFFEKSVEICRSVSRICESARIGQIKKSDALSKIEDLISIWDRLTEETIPI